MPDLSTRTVAERLPLAFRFYYGWFIVGLTFVAYLVASAVRSAPSVLIHPLEAEFGWGRTAISAAASLNLLTYGVMAPIGGWLLDRYGARRVVLACLATIAVAVSGTMVVRELWQFILLWGLVLGIATGVTPPLSASVATRWFTARRGLALGILTNANATGQVIFLPILMALIVSTGWRYAMALIVGCSVLLLPGIALWMRDRPADVGLEPYSGSKAETALSAAAARGEPVNILPIGAILKTPTFWLLSATFFVCGLTSNGLVGTHMIPYAIEKGIAGVAAATAVGIMGVASFVGTTLAGWLCDRIDPRKVLSIAYFFRGISLFVLPYVSESSGLFIFAVLYGLDWFATGPSTVAILARNFGQDRVGTLFGLVFVSHQVGSAVAAIGAGWIYSYFGAYFYAFLIGAVMGLLAAALSMVIRRDHHQMPPLPASGTLAKA